MTTQKNGFLLFSKPPISGLVKTRLTTKHDGPFTDLQAATLYRRMMLDVIECSMQALDRLEEQNRREREADPSVVEQTYEYFISTAPESNVDVMREVIEEEGPWPRPITIIVDKGKIFDDHFDDAFNQVFEAGCGTCISVGGDLPLLPRDHIIDAFNWLHHFQTICPEGGMVLTPCQACGTSMVGYTRDCGMDHQTVYYNFTGRPALQAYLDKAHEMGGVHMALLEAVPDVDNMEDLAHVVTYVNAIEMVQGDQDIFLPHRTLHFIRAMNLKVSTEPNRNFDDRSLIDA